MGIAEVRANFAAPGQHDVVLIVDRDGARLELDEPRAHGVRAPSLAHRLLALWGRRCRTRPVSWNEEDPAAGPLAGFLWGDRTRSTTLSETR